MASVPGDPPDADERVRVILDPDDPTKSVAIVPDPPADHPRTEPAERRRCDQPPPIAARPDADLGDL